MSSHSDFSRHSTVATKMKKREDSESYSEIRPRKEGTRNPKRSIACNRCHEQKSKCSGERPCSRCIRTGNAAHCRYANRDRKVRVGENYLEQLIRDSEELHAQRRQISQQSVPGTANPVPDGIPPCSTSYPSIVQAREPEQEIPWFQIPDSSALPIYTSEAAGAAFATRLCQCLSIDDSSTLHLPRWTYTDEPTLANLANKDIEWPSLVSAKLLLKTALGHINPAFHMVLKRETLDTLESIYTKRNFDNPILKCKYFVIFAIAKAHSTPHELSNTSHVPGTDYFSIALSLLRILQERPSIVHIECILLLAYFCQFLNRLHSAYVLIGNALRLSLTAGFNYNIPASNAIRPIEREHRIRLWWTIYIFDRFWGSKSGFPVQMQDDDIYVDLPSQANIGGCSDQFSDSCYQVASIGIAKITGQTTRDIYTKKGTKESFLLREQRILIELKQWVKSLPEHLRLHSDRENSKHTVLMHLQFSYCVILGLRPVLLNIMKRHQRKKLNITPGDETSPILATLSEACIHAARYSLRLCVDEWTSGSLGVFGYAFPAFIFSSSLVLLASNFLPTSIPSDAASIDTAAEMLKTLSTSHNLAAKDFYEQLQKTREYVQKYGPEVSDRASDTSFSASHDRADQILLTTQEQGQGEPSFPEFSFGNFESIESPSNEFLSGNLTTEMALQSSLMQEFLTQTTSEIDALHDPELYKDFDAAFLWPCDDI